MSREKAKFDQLSLWMRYPKSLRLIRKEFLAKADEGSKAKFKFRREENDAQHASIISFFKNKHIICSSDITIRSPALTGYHYKN